MADAYSQTHIPALNTGPGKATADLRTHVNKFVQLNDAGISLADTRSATPCFVLMSQANSGDACQLNQAPNVARVIAGAAITRGFYTEPLSASGLATAVASRTQSTCGLALTSAAGSGELFSVLLSFV